MKKKIILIIILIVILVTVILIINNRKNNEDDLIGQNESLEENLFEDKEVVLAEYIEKLKDQTLKNNGEKLKENKKINGLEISNVRITGKEKEMTMLIDIENTSKVVDGDKEVTFVMNNKEGDEIGRIGVYVATIQPQGVITLEIKTGLEFINTYSFTILDEPLSLPE